MATSITSSFLQAFVFAFFCLTLTIEMFSLLAFEGGQRLALTDLAPGTPTVPAAGAAPSAAQPKKN